ncbi:MAG: 4-diphosphocytidyl-2-C-methyl-D-erythritol kinase [Candidatus Binataceae bacterium]|nr:4-diphosphocytidyl-2-C-methyl-D-erythritol kinase [Candidatus Binataceae bacterium]
MVKLISAFAPAKLNLYLRVVGRRADGYHELDSIFVPITMGDRIAIETRPSDRSIVKLCGRFGDLPADRRNLAVRAAEDFMQEFAVGAEVLIDLRKSIPAGAGLGGGSSDAATVLRMMATLFRIDEPERLASVAVKIGADVPFFLNPIPARVTGIGERIVPLEAFAQFALVVAVPPIEVPTATIFRDLKPQDWSGPAPEVDVCAIASGAWSPHMFVNDLARVAMERWPEIARLKAQLEKLGARAASMTGSGAGVFGVFASTDEADRAAAELSDRDPAVTAFATAIYKG